MAERHWPPSDSELERTLSKLGPHQRGTVDRRQLTVELLHSAIGQEAGQDERQDRQEQRWLRERGRDFDFRPGAGGGGAF